MERIIRQRLPALLGTSTLLVVLFIFAAAAGAGEEQLVAGHWLGAGERDIRLELVVGVPAPAMVIVTLKLPAGTVIEQAQPPASRFDKGSGEAKWLLNGLASGRFPIDLRLSRAALAGELDGKIHYKHPGSGAMVEEEITPAKR
jgi:hypothetical protein